MKGVVDVKKKVKIIFGYMGSDILTLCIEL